MRKWLQELKLKGKNVFVLQPRNELLLLDKKTDEEVKSSISIQVAFIILSMILLIAGIFFEGKSFETIVRSNETIYSMINFLHLICTF